MATQPETEPSASPHPTGTVTFFFSDIEGSTARWEHDRAGMSAGLQRHDAVLRDAIEANGGYVFKKMGDSVCASFATAAQALHAALAAQRGLVDASAGLDDMRVRMAVHTGVAEEREGDYFGPAVNRVARLLAIGHGGQVLVSGTTADLLQGEMPAGSSLRELGAHRLRDLARPEYVYQLIAPGLPDAFPVLRSLDELPNNLPLQLTSFVGREDEVADIKAMIEQHRLATLVGAPGVGKTRCALQVGAELLDGSGDGVWLVEAASISDGAMLAATIAQALGVQESPDRPILESLTTYLKRKRLLLILDNCEHVIEDARTIVASFLRSSPEVRILVTSRESLEIAGEHVYTMPSLSIPDEETANAETSLRYGAAALFVDRAAAANSRFALTDENASSIGEICRRLDGIPLAIELAAARVKVLTPKQLAEKLDERFRVLTGGDRKALPRQQTMRALIDWSYDLLTDEERRLFRRLAIFAGGFSLASATAVCSDDENDEIAVLDAITTLVGKSLVQADPDESGTRYRLLESTREYGREKLVESGELGAVSRAHAQAFAELAEQFDRTWETTPDRTWIAQARPELENWRAAMDWALGPDGDVELAQRIAGALRYVRVILGVAEGRRHVQAALQTVNATTPLSVLAKLELAAAYIERSLTLYRPCLHWAQRAVEHYTELGDDLLSLAEAQRLCGRSHVMLEDDLEAGYTLLNESLRAGRALGAGKLTTAALHDLAYARSTTGPLGYEEALASARAAGSDAEAAKIAANKAEAHFRSGDALSAYQQAQEAVALASSLNLAPILALTTSNLSAYCIGLGRFDEARALAHEAVARARDLQLRATVLTALQHIAAVLVLHPPDDATAARAYAARSARILGFVDGCLAKLEEPREQTEQMEYDRILPALRNALGDESVERLISEGSTWSEDQIVAEALQ